MELIQIDSIEYTYAGSHLGRGIYEQLLLDTDTGVVYFEDRKPRYDADGRVMVIPRDQLPGVIAQVRAEISAMEAAAEEREKREYLRFMQD